MTTPAPVQAVTTPGKWVYVFSAAHGVKVGITSVDVELRRRGIEMAAGVPVEFVAAFACDRSRAGSVEMTAHRLLAPHRTLGEWFACSPQEAVDAVTAAFERAGQTPRPRAVPEARPEPVHPLVALAEVGGRATITDLKTLVGGRFVNGWRISPLRNRGFLEPWTDVCVLTEAGWAEAARLREIK